jgi:hypothetical protein
MGFAAACLAFVLAPAMAADPIPLTITADTRYSMELPKGLCHIDPNGHAADKKYFEYFTEQLQPDNQLLAAFGDCPSVDKMRKRFDEKGEQEDLLRWTQVMVPLLGKTAPRPVPQGMSREELVEMLIRVAGNDPSVDVSLAVRQLSAAPADQDPDPKNIGMLGRDKTAFYTGLLWRAREGGKTRLVGGVQAMTMVGTYAMAVNDFRTYAGRDSLDAGVADTREIVRGLIARNGK